MQALIITQVILKSTTNNSLSILKAFSKKLNSKEIEMIALHQNLQELIHNHRAGNSFLDIRAEINQINHFRKINLLRYLVNA